MTSSIALACPSPANDLSGYLSAIGRFPMLSEAHERELAERFRADEDRDSAWQLVTSHLRYVAKLARGFRGYGLPEEDLIQEGNVGLMKAVKRFDPAVGVRLAAFAVHWIRAEIHEYVLRNWRIVRLATTKAQRKLFFNLRGARRSLGQLTNEEAQAIAEDLNVKVSDVVEMNTRMTGSQLSFDGAESDAWAPEQWVAEEEDGPEQTVAQREYDALAHGELAQALEALDERSRDIVSRRWLREPKAPLRELADDHGVSMERVRQIEAKALEALRSVITPA
jgi:RNA polymerase sigma-32 factor